MGITPGGVTALVQAGHRVLVEQDAGLGSGISDGDYRAAGAEILAEAAEAVDVAIDQGGSIETIDRITTYSDPVFIKHGVVHYSVANIPGAVARTSTFALTNVTIPYALEIANKGWKQAIICNGALAKGVNRVNGKITYQAVAAAHGLQYTPLAEAIGY